MDAIDAALGTSRRILSALLDRVQPPHATSYAGTLVRSVPAQPERDSQAPRTPQP
jgi:hypothetical protein